MKQDVAAHFIAHHKTACLLTTSPLACHEAAAGEPVKRRFLRGSGRRDSNPRQLAWEAVCRKITARSLQIAFTSTSSTHNHSTRISDIVSRIHFEATFHSYTMCYSDYTRSLRKRQERQYVYCD